MGINGGRMDESFKRNRDVFEDEDELFGLWFPNHLCGIPATIQQNSSDWNDKNLYPSYKSDDMDPAVPFPVHVQGIKSWASTKIKLKKWRGKDLSYHEFIMKVFNHDDEAGQCAKWILAHYTSKITAAPKSQAPDLAAFLKKMRVDAFLGATTTYCRELMNVDFDKKPYRPGEAMCMLMFLHGCCSDDCTSQCVFRCVLVWISGLLGWVFTGCTVQFETI